MNYYISDMHFGHKNIIAYDNRLFFTVQEMEDTLINNWNIVVTNADIVYILGDMFWCSMAEALIILDKLNGQKVLIKGNHDRCHDSNFIKKFIKIVDYLEIEDGDKDVVLCHYPIPCFKNHYYGWYHLYGHVHKSFEYNMMENIKFQMTELYDMPCNMYNVGCMVEYMNYTPRSLEEICKGKT